MRAIATSTSMKERERIPVCAGTRNNPNYIGPCPLQGDGPLPVNTESRQ
ncbi:MAG TPA: hypothetical protein VJS47_02635 [Rhizomicrobium sp.]|nr:hypothetical protein [Rhizomicrobium sp.]